MLMRHFLNFWIQNIQIRIVRIGIVILAAVFVLFLSIPLIVVLLRALEVAMIDQFTQPTVSRAVQLSLITSLASTLITIVFGMPLAYILARRRLRGQRV